VALVALQSSSNGRAQVSLLITGGTVVTMDRAGTVIADAAVSLLNKLAERLGYDLS
jgi:hypothetical protein